MTKYLQNEWHYHQLQLRSHCKHVSMLMLVFNWNHPYAWVQPHRARTISGLNYYSRVFLCLGGGSLTINSPESMCCLIKTNNRPVFIVNIFSDIFTSPPLHSWFSSCRQLCQAVKELLTLTGSDEAVQADVFLFALGETASLTLSWLILGLGLSQRQCLYLLLHTLSLQEGHACNYGCILQSGCSWGSCAYLSVRSIIRCCSVRRE